MTRVDGDRATLLETIETQRLGCELAGSPLYADVLAIVADDVRAGGPSARLLDPVATAPFGDAVLLRFLGALHRVVLEGRAPGLAAHYPSAGGRPGPGLADAVVATIEAHADVIAEQLTYGVQTNEVGRSAAIVGGLLEIARDGLPIRLLEVGSSAGLNLNVDRYRYDAGDAAVGPVDAELTFDRPWVAAHPDLTIPLDIVERRGSDPAPIDATTPAGRLRLRSFVWADQTARLARLDAAMAIAEAHPPMVEVGDAVSWVVTQLAEPVVGTCTVVVHSIVLQYLAPADRTAFLARLDEAGARATPEAPLAWLRLEPGGDQAELRLTRWPAGTTHLLATSAYHGPPVVWRGTEGATATGAPAANR